MGATSRLRHVLDYGIADGDKDHISEKVHCRRCGGGVAATPGCTGNSQPLPAGGLGNSLFRPSQNGAIMYL